LLAQFLKAIALLALVLVVSPEAWCAGEGDPADETMLMFVGEDLSVVTAASRRPEPAAKAPAVIGVVNHAAIEDHGFKTLAELLATQPGFYMNPGERGTTPFLRGIPNGILLLYDGVPMNTDVTKNAQVLDEELSLRSVKQVEAVRGPGSVLWGPDAFAGVVNVVPFTGRDRPGVETGVFGGSDRYRGAFLNWGSFGENWDAFISGYGAKDRFWDNTFLVQSPTGTPGESTTQASINDSYYTEFTGNARVGDWLQLSGRYSDFKRRFTLQDTGDLSWAGERKSPIDFIKATLSQELGRSRLSLTGYYEHATYEVTDVDLKREQKNDIYNGDLQWDCPVWEGGHLTTGLSYRSNHVNNAVVQGGFLPDFLKPSNIIFVPEVTQADFTNELYSAFAQYRQQWRDVEFWLGARLDDPSDYESRVSYSLGVNWAVEEHWRIKAAFGNAYRSPLSAQLFGGAHFEPEEISTANLQVAWTPRPGSVLELTGFYSRVTDHIREDPYGGLSEPTSQDFVGGEFAARHRLLEKVELYGNVTAFENWGGSERYRVLRFSFVRPDGTRVDVFDSWSQPFDAGPNWMGNLGVKWEFLPKASLLVEGRMTGSVPFSFNQDTVSGSYSQDALIGAALTVRDLFVKESLLTVRGTNLLDQHYKVPGAFGPVDGQPLAFYVQWALQF